MQLAQNLGMDVVAEGVETEQQRAQLGALECAFGQGYYFSKPLDHDAAEAFLRNCVSQSVVKPQVVNYSQPPMPRTSAAPTYVHNEI